MECKFLEENDRNQNADVFYFLSKREQEVEIRHSPGLVKNTYLLLSNQKSFRIHATKNDFYVGTYKAILSKYV